MKSRSTSPQGRPDKTRDLSLKNLDSFMHHMNGLLKKLVDKVNVLPRVDDKGGSECPFAEDLYAEKEEIQKVSSLFYHNFMQPIINL